jgi:multidrug efflux system membrane fusion protein
MRAYFSYGIAALIIIIVGAWLATGTLIQGGQGPGKGERPVIALIEGKDGPIQNTLDSAGVLAHPVKEVDVDPELTIAQRQEEKTGGDAAGPRSVRIQTFTAKPMAIEVPLRGQTKAKSSVTAAAETTGVVASVAVSKGQTVKAGDLLCTLDQGTRQAALEQAQAGLAQAQQAYDTNAALVKKGVTASNTTAAAEASLKAAQAAVDQAQAELDRTEIHAKSDGVVQDPLANVGAMLAAGSPCATIVQMDPILFTGNVPEARIGLARLGLEAKVTTITGQEAEGKVTYIAPVSDPDTRSFPIEIELANPDNDLRAGVTATAVVDIGTAPAQLLPQSVLTLDDEGALGVRTVENDKVAFYPVTIVNDTRDGVWVTGLPAQADVITLGQEYVKAGQAVNAEKADPETGKAITDAPDDAAPAAAETDKAGA